MMLVIIFEQIFLLYFDAGGRSLLVGDHLENCWLATSNSCIIQGPSYALGIYHVHCLRGTKGTLRFVCLEAGSTSLIFSYFEAKYQKCLSYGTI